MFFHLKTLKSENNNPCFYILLHTQSIVCATVDSQCSEYLGYITLMSGQKNYTVNKSRSSVGKNKKFDTKCSIHRGLPCWAISHVEFSTGRTWDYNQMVKALV